MKTLGMSSKLLKASFLVNEGGVSLVAVLWIVTILTVLASEFLYSMQLEIRIARNWSDRIDALYSAKSGFEIAVANLRNDETAYDSLDEEWTEGFTGQLNNSTYTTKLTDESSKINVNTADQETLTRIIEYCLNTMTTETLELDRSSEAQQIASAIIESRPYRTVAEMAKAKGMTPELLYGEDQQETSQLLLTEEETEEEEEQKIVALVDIITVYSTDKNVDNNGQNRVNISTANANDIQQGLNTQGQSVITQQEAQAIVDYRSEVGGGQQQQPGQGGQPQFNQGSQQQQPGQGGQQAQSGYSGIGQLLDVPAISQETLDAIRDRVTVEDEGGDEGEGGQSDRVNINTAGAEELQNLHERIDNGIADSIVRYRENNRFDNVDELREVKAISIDDMRAIVDKVTTTDEATTKGKVNINTAPLEVLRALPGMDEEKANAIIAYRTAETTTSTGGAAMGQRPDQQGGAFESLNQLLDVQGIDENTFRQLIDNVTYRSSAFLIESEGRSADRKVVQTCVAVVDRSENRIKIKYWKQS